jgi:uncharacterized protein (TIGR00299 family) protein
MKIAYFDCFSGASGDMILGALIDAGLSPRGLREELKKLHLPAITVKVKKVLKGGISATRVTVEGKGEKRPHRDLKEMLKIVNRSNLDQDVKTKSREIFERIATTEAEIHRSAKEKIHFHELGGLDSVVDICGAVWGLRQMGIDQIHVSKVNVGTGFVRCEHGLLPVPAPASLSLMKGKPIYSSGVDKELLTPTGAAILTTLGSSFGNLPPMKVERIGYGAGRDDLPHPNVLRLMIGTSETAAREERVMVVETNIDDMNPQFYDYIMEQMLKMGVKEVFLTPVFMKKNRPATLLTAICSLGQMPVVTEFLFRETTTIGLRWREERRALADRETLSFDTKYGKIRFKLAWWGGKVINVSPEYEDCKRLALERKIPLKEVFLEARRLAVTVSKGNKVTGFLKTGQ